MNRLKLYRALKEANYPQGGQGAYLLDPETDERVYLPRPEEIYNQYLADPKGWERLTDYMAQAWIENTTGKRYEEHPVIISALSAESIKILENQVQENGIIIIPNMEVEEELLDAAIEQLIEPEEIKEVVEIVEVKTKGKGKSKKTASPK